MQPSHREQIIMIAKYKTIRYLDEITGLDIYIVIVLSILRPMASLRVQQHSLKKIRIKEKVRLNPDESLC